MKYSGLLMLLIFLPVGLFAITLNPLTFTESNLSTITNETKVYLEPGVYNLTSAMMNAWTSGAKNNVTFQGTGSGIVEMNGESFSNQPQLIFSGWDSLMLKSIKFVNIEVQFDNCTNSTMDSLVFTGQKYTGSYSRNYSIRILDGENCTVSNCHTEWTFTGWTGLGIKVSRGKSHRFINNTITGRLTSGMAIVADKKATNSKDPVTNHLVEGGMIRRDISSGEEDHGMYIHNISNVTVRNVDFIGFTDDAGGQGIKIKGANYIEVDNCDFATSGIIIRVADNWPEANDHIWIHDNRLHDGSINSWTTLDDGFVINNSCVIENNYVFNGIVEAKTEDPASFNMYNDLAGKDGGIYNNHTNSAIDILAGINVSGNDFDLSGLPQVSVTGVVMRKDSILLDAGDFANLTKRVYPIDATDKTVSWLSIDTLVAKVSSTGEISALSSGTTKIAVITLDGGHADTCVVTVICRPPTITPYLKVNDDSWQQTSTITVNVGDSLILSPLPRTISWKWEGPNDYSSTFREITLSNIQTNQSGIYVAVGTSVCGAESTETYSVSVEENNVSMNSTSEKAITAYPNPFASTLIIPVGENEYKQLKLMNMTGRELVSKDIRQANELNFSPSYSVAPAGIYIIRLISEDKVKTLRVLRK